MESIEHLLLIPSKSLDGMGWSSQSLPPCFSGSTCQSIQLSSIPSALFRSPILPRPLLSFNRSGPRSVPTSALMPAVSMDNNPFGRFSFPSFPEDAAAATGAILVLLM